MPLTGIALAPLLVSPLAPVPSPRVSVAAAAEAARRRRSLRRFRCSVAAASGGDAGELSRATLLWRAAKLPIYSVALVPLTVGSAAAYNQAGLFFATRYFGLLAAAVLVITWLNLSNDVYDSDTGADKNKQESVINIVGSRTATQYAANVSLLLGFVGLFWAFAQAGDVRFIVLVLCAILCGYVYQCPPFRLSYHGLGEPLCFAAFGPLATTAFYFSNSSTNISSGTVLLPLSRTVIASSIIVGLTTTLILLCSHFHQIDGDRAVGKMSPLVKIGTKTGATLVTLAVGTLYTLLVAFGIRKYLPSSCIVLGALTLPLGKWVVDYVQKNHDDNTKIFMAKYYCVRLHALFGMALASGLVLARKVGRPQMAITLMGLHRGDANAFGPTSDIYSGQQKIRQMNSVAQLVVFVPYLSKHKILGPVLGLNFISTYFPHLRFHFWTVIENLFLDNKKSHVIHLDAEFRNTPQGGLSISDYYAKLKSLADSLTDVGQLISDEILVLTFLRGVNDSYSHLHSFLPFQVPFPSFLQTRSALLLEEMQKKVDVKHAVDTALWASGNSVPPHGGGAPLPLPPPSRDDRNPGRGFGGPHCGGRGGFGRGGRGRGRDSPWQFNP